MRTLLFFATPKTKDVERRPCPTKTHTYTLFSFSPFMDVSRHRYPFVILTPLFFVFFFLPLDTNRLRGESSFRLERLGTPPHEPSRVDIAILASLFAAQCAARCYRLIKSEITYFQKGLLGLYLVKKKTRKTPYIKEYLRTCQH